MFSSRRGSPAKPMRRRTIASISSMALTMRTVSSAAVVKRFMSRSGFSWRNSSTKVLGSLKSQAAKLIKRMSLPRSRSSCSCSSP